MSKPKKYLGQHFLIDQQIIQKILMCMAPKLGDNILEIGPGRGALTQGLLSQVKKITAIEFDSDLIPNLIQNCTPLGTINIIQADALTFSLETLTHDKLRIIGNLPYYIATPLLFHFLAQRNLIQDMHFMLQREVADRLIAQPGTPAYGRITVMIQYYARVETLFTVAPKAFSPAPKVYSAFVRIQPYEKLPHPAQDEQLFSTIVRTAFNQRRKMLRNSLRNILSDNQLNTLKIDPTQRAQTLTLADYVKLANAIDAIQSP
jgi:16S rRNA (adenine1518-N6/adenine1519-N6)-dimethyltransferase